MGTWGTEAASWSCTQLLTCYWACVKRRCGIDLPREDGMENAYFPDLQNFLIYPHRWKPGRRHFQLCVPESILWRGLQAQQRGLSPQPAASSASPLSQSFRSCLAGQAWKSTHWWNAPEVKPLKYLDTVLTSFMTSNWRHREAPAEEGVIRGREHFGFRIPELQVIWASHMPSLGLRLSLTIP